MMELGKKQTLLVVKTVDFGVYLAEDMNADTRHQVLGTGERPSSSLS